VIKRQVYRVDSVELTPIKTKPPQINISAYGTASTPGWTQPSLVPFIYIQAPPDGIYDFSLVALPPLGGVTTQELTPLPEPASLTEFTPPGFRGARIHALQNKIEGLLGSGSVVSRLLEEDAATNLAQHLGGLSDYVKGLSVAAKRKKALSAAIQAAVEASKETETPSDELSRRLQALAVAVEEANQETASEGQDCRHACHQTYLREVARCRDVSCVTRVTGQYVACLVRCPK
jgi:hypothetical protein